LKIPDHPKPEFPFYSTFLFGWRTKYFDFTAEYTVGILQRLKFFFNFPCFPDYFISGFFLISLADFRLFPNPF